jgi:hypothetical protein
MEYSETPLTYGGLLARVVAKEEKALSADGSPYSRFGGGTRDALVGISYKLKDLAEYLRDDGASMKDIMGRVLAGRESNYPVLVFNLEDISEKVRAVVLELILRSIARYMYHRGPLAYLRDKAIILAVDEAYLVTRPMRQEGRSKSVLEEIARAGRSYGLALILATQRLSDVADGIRQNCQMWIVFNTASPEDVKILGELDFKVMARVVPKLKPGEAYIRTPNPRALDYYRTTTDTVAAIVGYIFRMERDLLQVEEEGARRILQRLEKGEAELEEITADIGEGSSLLSYGQVCYRCMLITADLNHCPTCGQPPLLKRPEPKQNGGSGNKDKAQKQQPSKPSGKQVTTSGGGKSAVDTKNDSDISEVDSRWFLDVKEVKELGGFDETWWLVDGEEIMRRVIARNPELAEHLQNLRAEDIANFVVRYKMGTIDDVDFYVKLKLLKKVGKGKASPTKYGKALLAEFEEMVGGKDGE